MIARISINKTPINIQERIPRVDSSIKVSDSTMEYMATKIHAVNSSLPRIKERLRSSVFLGEDLLSPE